MKKKIIIIAAIIIAIIAGIVVYISQKNPQSEGGNISSFLPFFSEVEDIPTEEDEDEILIEENKNFFTFLDTVRNTEDLSSGRIDGQVKFISSENNTYKELINLALTGNFENNEKIYKFRGIMSFDFPDLDLEVKFPTSIKNLGTDDFTVLLEVPTAYKKAFSMTEQETYLRIDQTSKEKIDEVTKQINKETIKINNNEVENVSDKIQKEKIVNTLNFIESDSNSNTGIYDICFNQKAILSLYKQIEDNERYSNHLLIKYFKEKVLKDEANIKSMHSLKGQIAVSKGVATDIYFEVESETYSIIAYRITLLDINSVNVENTEYHSNEVKQFDSFIETLVTEPKTADTNSDKTITIGNIYYTGKDETQKIDTFTKDMLVDPINVFINYSKCTPKTNLVVRWFYENQTIQIIENTLNNGEYEDGILKSSITFKDIDNVPLGKYRVEIYIEGQSKCYGKAEFKIE